MTTSLVWQQIKKMLSQSEQTHLRKVCRVFQKNFVIRFDLWVDQGYEDILMDSIAKASRGLGWHIRSHIGNPMDRPAHLSPVPVPTRKVLLRLATWNIQGIRNKKIDVESFTRDEHIDVLLLQETLIPEDQWALRIHGFDVVTSCYDAKIHGARGVAVAVKRGICAYTLSSPNPYFLFVRIIGRDFPNSLIVGCVYIPMRDADNTSLVREVKLKVLAVVEGYKTRFPGARVIIAGDFNTRASKFESLLSKKVSCLHMLRFSGSSLTFHRRAKGVSGIDYVLSSSPAGFGKCRVCRSHDASDHWPVTVTLSLDAPALEETKRSRKRLLAPKDRVQFEAIPVHNKFQVLADTLGEAAAENIDDIAQSFVDTCYEVAADVGAFEDKSKSSKPPKETAFISHEARRLIAKKRAKYAMLNPYMTDEELDLAYKDYLRARKECHKVVRQERKEKWLSSVEEGLSLAHAGKFKYFWRWIKSFWEQSSRTAVTPIQDPESGELLVTPEEIAQKWAEHYGGLAADVTGHSRDREYWARKMEGVEQLSTLRCCDHDITWSEVNSILINKDANKAPGLDGITTSFLKLAVTKSDADGPTTPFGVLIFGLVKAMFKSGVIPECWQSALVVSVPKKGDKSLMDNYRGISLIAEVVKVLATIISRRLSQELVDLGRIRREQAGFRTLEECVAQATSLYEVVQRRLHQGKPTWVVFFDLKKAFDTVPHMALIEKIRKIGVNGKTLAFIDSLYSCSSIAVNGGSTTYQAELLRGVRQGCPMSPLLFDIFINDVLDRCSEWEVSVPGSDEKLAGLLFADDLAAVAEDPEAVNAASKAIGDWSTDWEMTFGIKKCGVMLFQPKDSFLVKPTFTLCGQEIPNVSEYVYLGIRFTEDLDLRKTLEYRLEKYRKTVAPLAPFLGCKAIPVHYRAMVFRSVAMASLMYGSELWGMNQELASIAQKAVNKSLRILAGSKAVQIETFLVEIGMPTVHAEACARRARLYDKAGAGLMKTWLTLLHDARPTMRKHTWVTGTHQYLRRFHNSPLADEEHTPRSLSREVSSRTVKRVLLTKRVNLTKSWMRYLEGCLLESREWVDRVPRTRPRIYKGFAYLLKMRTGCFFTAHRLANAGLIDEEFKSSCPFCGAQVPETMEHLFLTCSAWDSIREEYISGLIARARCLSVTVDQPDDVGSLVTLLLGGSVAGCRLDCWASWPSDPNDRPENVPELGAVMVAGFLHMVACSRGRKLAEMLGGEFTPEDQGPEG
jgi:exonuclease III